MLSYDLRDIFFQYVSSLILNIGVSKNTFIFKTIKERVIIWIFDIVLGVDEQFE